MNRQERRRQERAESKRPTVIVGDGIIAAGLGQEYEAQPFAKLAPKVLGKHRWIATGAWVLSDAAVEKADDPDTMKFLDNENMMTLSVGCWDCEEPLGVILPGSNCPAAGDDE